MSNEFKYIEELGTDYFKSAFLEHEEENIDYGRDSVPVGVDKRTGRVWRLDVSEALRILIIGMTRSGKTWILRSLSDRLTRMGYANVFLPDVKNEFHTSNKPLQEKFHKLLYKGERPSATKVKVFRPTFFKQFSRALPTCNEWFSLRFEMISKTDFMTLMRADSLTQVQRITMEIIFREASRALRKNNDFSWDLFEQVIDGIEDLNANQRLSLRYKFVPLKTSHFIESEHFKNFLVDLKNGVNVAFNMEGFDNLGKGGYAYPDVIFSVVFRAVVNARRAKRLPPLWFWMDELPRFVSVNRDTAAKELVMESADLDTRYNINHCYVTQEISKLPEELVRQCRYWFIPNNIDVITLKSLLYASGLVRNPQSAGSQALGVKRLVRRFEWVVIDRTERRWFVIKPFAPLSWHAETTN